MFGVAGLRKTNGKFGSGCGVRKLKKYLLHPKTVSLEIVEVGDQRQLIAGVHGVP